MQPNCKTWVIALVSSFSLSIGALSEQRESSVGVAKINVTPGYPIRLSGYGDRRTPSEGVAQQIWAKALAIGSDQEKPAIWITLDNCGLSARICDEVASRLRTKARIGRERIAFSSTHTHTGPCLSGVLPNLFSQDILPEEQATIDRYTKELTDELEQVALAALADRRPAQLSWGHGIVNFAQNRRTSGGPVDHTLSLLRVAEPGGKIRALLLSYACHCTTLGGSFNKVHGDWAGCAQEAVEEEFPSAIALVSLGCGGDANPLPRGKLPDAVEHGKEIAGEVKRMLKQALIPLDEPISCRTKQIDLPFQEHFTREQWEKRAQQKGIVGYHARKNLARLDRGEKLPDSLPYLVQTWNFGKELALVFLSGEVVVDYELRLKREFDSTRLWVTAYANEVPCYIPSKRVLQEGGYEAEESLWYYDRPARLRAEVEERIIAAVHDITPRQFLFDAKKAEFPPPKSAAEALGSFRTKADLKIELAAYEPLVVDPVAIDFGPDGKLWVCEMHDYPSGLDGNGKPGGRIKFLQDVDGDGRFDKATLFLDGIPFPTGVMAWRKGALVCAAPDILYAEDTNGDGKADVVKKLYSGFATHNFQARVNGLSWGLDGWVYGAAGLFGGNIASAITGKSTELSGRDFRIKPETGQFEPVSGLSQQSRVRDDFGNWFGCDNSTLIWHFPMPERYLRRNPHVPAPEPRIYPVHEADPNQLYPVSRTLERFNEPNAANRTTSACGLEIYRDEFLGTEYAGNAFVCEPVHNLVHRLVLQPDGVTFSARRSGDEEHSEFLASTDNWFRPVQVRTGPDGALWVVDMYRFVVEHPRWIPKERLAKLDPRAGDDKGRIYRLVPRSSRGHDARLFSGTLPNVHSMSSPELAKLLVSANGPVRDLAHREILDRNDKSQLLAIFQIATNGTSAAARIQALAVVEGFNALRPSLLQQALADSDARVREQALRLSEPLLSISDALDDSVSGLVGDADERVRFQLAMSLGEWKSPKAGKLLGQLAANGQNHWIEAAILSSAIPHSGAIAEAVLSSGIRDSERIVARLIGTAIGSNKGSEVERIWARLESAEPIVRLAAAEATLDALQRAHISVERLFRGAYQLRTCFVRATDEAVEVAMDKTAPERLRLQAIRVLGRDTEHAAENVDRLTRLSHSGGPNIAKAAVDAIARTGQANVPDLLLSSWSSYAPATRSAVLSTLLNRTEWIQSVLDAIGAAKIAPAEVPLANRERLLKSKDTAIAKRAETLFGAHASEDRAKVLAQFQSTTTLTGDPARGAQMFEKVCATCHALNGKGYAVGPDLSSLRDKPADYFLLAILDPSAAIEPKFVNYEVETKDGRSLSGVIQSETANEITLVQPNGLKEQIFRTAIDHLKASSRSLMPDGLEQGAIPQDFADLISYIKSAGPARFGGATPQQAAAARTQFLKEGGSSLTKLVFASENLPYGGWLGRAQMPHCRQTDGTSRIVWEALPGRTSSTTNQVFRFPVAMGFISQPKGDFMLKINSKEVLRFEVSLADADWQSADGQIRMHYTVREANSEDSDGLLEIEVPASMLKPDHSALFEVLASAANSQRWFGIYLLDQSK